jgi:uncharacterized protein YegL
VDVSRLTAEERHTLDVGLHLSFLTNERNPEPQHPVLLVVDDSLSMKGSPIDELNRAIQEELVPTMQNDPLIARSVVIGIAGFSRSGKRALEILHSFAPPAAFFPPHLKAETSTPHCQRLCEAISLLAALSEGMRKAFEVPVRHAWCFDFTDGQPGDLDLHGAAIRASRVVAIENNIECFFFGVGRQANLQYLRTLEQPGKEARHLGQAGDWRQFFRWLHQSIRLASQSMVGEEINLPDITGSGKPFRTRT